MLKKILLMIVMSVALTMSCGVVSFAEEATNNITINSDSNDVYSKYAPSKEVLDNIVPTVTIDEVTSWGERKGYEVVGMLQKWVQPFAIIIFIISAFVVMFGAFGNGRLMSRGLIGIAIALIMYGVVLFAPEILDSFLGWIMS